MKLTEFYKNEYTDYSSYSTLRMIASAIDGQKNAQRKILYTISEKNIKNDYKVSQLSSVMAQFAEYLHGDASGVISNMAQEFAGTNNIPLLTREGNFGTRFKNEPSAPRYIYTYGSDEFWKLFNKSDNPVLDKQYFEGEEIEPKFYVPNLPMLLINGSTGAIASGFKQDILPRDPKDIKKYLKSQLKGTYKNVREFTGKPYFEGFEGTIEQGEESRQWLIKGKFRRINTTSIEITEVPVGIELKKYIKTLDKLEDDDFIIDYKDNSNEKFNFIVKFKRGVLDTLTDDQILQKFGLVKKFSEIYNAIDENLRVRTFKDANDIFNYYYDIKLQYLQKRKDYLIAKISNDIKLDVSKYMFIKAIIDGDLVVNKRKKVDIEKDLKKFPKILEKDNNYDYLLNMAIYSLTEERMNKLMESIKSKKTELDLVRTQTVEQMWLKDLG